jgi:WD40 repeat protein
VVVNGREGPGFEMAGRPSLSRDGRVVAHWAIRDDGYFVRIGDRDEPAFDFVIDPVVSADGSTVAYAGERDQNWFLHVGGKETALAVRPQSLFLSADGRQVGWIEHQDLPAGGSKMRVVAFGKEGKSYGIVSGPAFSPNEALVAYGAEDEIRKFVVIGTREIETPDRAGDPVFSPDGRTVGYGARIGRELWWKVLNVP